MVTTATTTTTGGGIWNHVVVVVVLHSIHTIRRMVRSVFVWLSLEEDAIAIATHSPGWILSRSSLWLVATVSWRYRGS